MRRHSSRERALRRDEAAEASRRRLELLGRELEQAGLSRVEEEGGSPFPEPAVVASAGRHARTSRGSAPRRMLDRLADHVPATFRGEAGLRAGPAALVVVVVVLGLAAAVYALTRTGEEAGRLGAASPAPASPLVTAGPPTARASPGPSGGTPAAASVTVDVAGRVRRPGVTTLPSGSRVIDALRRAGGARAGVDLSGLNLARILVDGEQILVGRPPQPGGVAASAAAGAAPPSGALVNLNTATAEQLDTLPGVGPVTAAKILDWRGAHGAFSSVDELLEVDGIGEKTLADLAPLVTV